MTLRAPSTFPALHWRRDPRAVRHDEHFIGRVMSAWDRGLDTADIAKSLMESEAAVSVALRVGREQRRQGG